MPDKELFVEVFPVNQSAIPPLYAYGVEFVADEDRRTGGRLAYRLRHEFPGDWIWSNGMLISDQQISVVTLNQLLEKLRTSHPEIYESYIQIAELPSSIEVGPKTIANWVAWTLSSEAQNDMQNALAEMRLPVSNGVIQRDYQLLTWIVDSQPAISLSILGHLLSNQDLSQFIHDQKDIAGLWVADRTSSLVGQMLEVTGKLGDYRDDLLELTKREPMKELLRSAPDDDDIILLRAGRYEYEYPASALQLMIRSTNDEELERFGMNRWQIERILQMNPEQRAQIVRTLSGILKQHNVIDNAYNARLHPEYFPPVKFVPNLKFADNKLAAYSEENLSNTFWENGVYRKRDRFSKSPIKIGIINTLEVNISDFVEAMRRQLESDFDFQIEVLRERQVRVVSSKNMDSALRVIGQENPQIVLAFFPDRDADDDTEYQYLKSLAIGKGIAIQMVTTSLMDDPDKMSAIIMGLLAKTGNIPYVFAEPLEYADLVVGWSIIRDQNAQGARVTAIARIYRNNGEFIAYRIHQVELQKDEAIPLIVLQELLPPELIRGKKVILHRDGRYNTDEAEAIRRWFTMNGAQHYLVEIGQYRTPRIYALEDKHVRQPPWGTVFRVNEQEAFMVTSQVPINATPAPLHIRVADGNLAIELAIYSVLAWILLHYDPLHTWKLPATIHYADEIKRWVQKGTLPEKKADETPFWL